MIEFNTPKRGRLITSRALDPLAATLMLPCHYPMRLTVVPKETFSRPSQTGVTRLLKPTLQNSNRRSANKEKDLKTCLLVSWEALAIAAILYLTTLSSINRMTEITIEKTKTKTDRETYTTEPLYHLWCDIYHFLPQYLHNWHYSILKTFSQITPN